MDEELHRHQSEVREWLRRGADQPKEWLVSMLQDIAKKRGKAAAEKLRVDIKAQWAAGNRGAIGDWRQSQEGTA